MNFTRNDISRLVIESLREMLEQDRVTDIIDIKDDTDPINDLGRDSPDGIEFAVSLSDKLNFHIPNDINPFVDDDHRVRRVGQIVDLIAILLAQEQETNHG